MANTKSAKKNILINQRNRARNVHFKSKMKTFIKKALEAIEAKTEERQKIVADAMQIIDKTSGKGIIHKKTASRKKSRLAIALNKSLV
jgi:small subunit ribosomal protein S20